MESLGLIIGILVAIWFLGFARTVRTLASAGDDQVRALGMKAQESLRKEAKKLGEIPDAEMQKIKTGLARYEEFKL